MKREIGFGFLVLKLFYNTAAAVAGGYVAAWIARRRYFAHGLAVAVLQTLAFVWALTNPDLRKWTPDWIWAALMVLTFAGILVGARLRAQHDS